MVTRKRLRAILNALALYALTALLIGYFGVNAYNGDRGLRAKEDIDRVIEIRRYRSRPARRTRAGAARLCRPQRPDADAPQVAAKH